MEDFGLCLQNYSVGDHIKCSEKCCLRMTIAFITVVPVAILLALLNFSTTATEVFVVILVVDSVFLVLSFVSWGTLVLCNRKKRLRESAIQNQGKQGELGIKLEHGCTTGGPESNMDVHHPSIGNEQPPCTLTQPAKRRGLASRLPPLNVNLPRVNDHQCTTPDTASSGTTHSTLMSSESGKTYTFYFDEDQDAWKIKDVSSTTDPSKSESVEDELLPCTSSPPENSNDLATRDLPLNAGLLKENDHKDQSPDIPKSDPVRSTSSSTAKKHYTLYYDEDLKIFTFKNSPQNIDASESKCCMPKCWPRSMRPAHVDRTTSSEKDESFELETMYRNDLQQNSEGGYLASVEESISSSQNSLKISQNGPKQVQFASVVEHLTSGERSTLNRYHNQWSPPSFPTDSRQGLPSTEGRPLTSPESSGQDFPGNKSVMLTSSDGTSSSHDLGQNRGRSRQCPKSFPNQTPGGTEGHSLTMNGSSNCGNLISNTDQIHSSSTSINIGKYPNNPNTKRSRILHQLLSAVLKNDAEVLPEISLPLNNSEQSMPTQASRFDIPNLKYKLLPSDNFQVNITMNLTRSEFEHFMEKRKYFEAFTTDV